MRADGLFERCYTKNEAIKLKKYLNQFNQNL